MQSPTPQSITSVQIKQNNTHSLKTNEPLSPLEQLVLRRDPAVDVKEEQQHSVGSGVNSACSAHRERDSDGVVFILGNAVAAECEGAVLKGGVAEARAELPLQLKEYLIIR